MIQTIQQENILWSIKKILSHHYQQLIRTYPIKPKPRISEVFVSSVTANVEISVSLRGVCILHSLSCYASSIKRNSIQMTKYLTSNVNQIEPIENLK